jgi:hypothetical protein
LFRGHADHGTFPLRGAQMGTMALSLSIATHAIAAQ